MYDLSNINTNFFLESTLNNIEISQKVALVIPWRATPSRITLFDHLIDWYSKEFPCFEIILSDSGHETFNLSASRNMGIKKAFSGGNQVVICSDSDVFVSKDSVIKSILSAVDTNNITVPYTELRKISQEGTEKFLNNDSKSFDMTERITEVPSLTEGEKQRLSPCAGIIILTDTIFNEFGGFDESYSGWGIEDIDYHKRYLDKYGRLFDYIDGSLISLYHSRAEWTNPDSRNIDLFKSKYGSNFIF